MHVNFVTPTTKEDIVSISTRATFLFACNFHIRSIGRLVEGSRENFNKNLSVWNKNNTNCLPNAPLDTNTSPNLMLAIRGDGRTNISLWVVLLVFVF